MADIWFKGATDSVKGSNYIFKVIIFSGYSVFSDLKKGTQVFKNSFLRHIFFLSVHQH
jgi:hypothetical protein